MLTKVPSAGDGFFAGIVPQTVPVRGVREPFELPQRYYNWELMLGHFPASAEAIRRLLPAGSGLEPVTVAPGIGVVTLGAFEYKRCATLLPYNEVGVMFPVRLRPALPLPAIPLFRPEWFSDLGFYIWQLPVTTKESFEAGTQLWNFPKKVGVITFGDVGDRRRCEWYHNGELVLTLEVRKSNTARQLRNFLAYSVLRGRLQQTLVQTYGDYDESRFGLDASFALGTSAIAIEMRKLGIVDAAIGRLYCPRAEGILPGPSAAPYSKAPAPLRAPRIFKSIVSRSMPGRPGPTVAILGGGVAGLSAAHELAERGYDVTVYEHREIAGGKARSQGVPDSAGESHLNLPCEHGFRFFPGFYKHLPDTMARIPYRQTGKTVIDNLVGTTRVAIDFIGDKQLVFPTRFPASFDDLGTLLRGAGLVQQRTGCSAREIALYIGKIWQLLTSCKERRLEQYEKISWWEFIEGDRHSDAYKKYLASTTRALVAADPEKASTRTVGNVLLQMLFDLATPGVSVDRVLNGPTNEVWIDPWVDYLKTLGVKWRRGTIEKFNVGADRQIGGVVVDGEVVRATYYVAAVPVEAMAKLIASEDELVAIDPSLVNIEKLSADVESMTGIQFYFRETLPLEAGHYMHLDSKWALTSLAQAQFWKTDLSRYGDTTIRDILSVDISDWNSPGLNGKTANQCTRKEIKEEVLAQLRKSLPFLQGTEPATIYLDEDIVEEHGHVTNVEPLLVNVAEHWHLRPEATTAISNLFLASDYVRTYTDLATMEGANEAARRAVNAILDADHSTATRCAIWDLHDPLVLAPWRWIDRQRYFRGLDWNSDYPLALRGLQIAFDLTNVAARAIGRLVGRDAEGERDTAVSLKAQRLIGDKIEAFIDTMERGAPRDLVPLFVPRAVITIGLWQGALEEFLPYVTPTRVTIREIKSLYQLGGRVHLRLTVELSELEGGGRIEGHVHAVFVQLERDAWTIASLRYRREHAPVQLEAVAAP